MAESVPDFVVTADMEAEEATLEAEAEAAETARADALSRTTQMDAEMQRSKLVRLRFLLQQTELFTNFLSENMKSMTAATPSEDEAAAADGASPRRKRSRGKDGEVTVSPRKGAKKKKTLAGDAIDVDAVAATPAPVAAALDTSLLTGGVLRDYQRRGVQWMISLYENGLNGILADEMGLGKTIQTLAFLGHLRARGVWGPFLIVAPLATLGNWVREIRKFTPSVPDLLYHGPKDVRAQLRRERLVEQGASFPIVVTSFEIAMRDAPKLRGIKWNYIIVDEGHRLKNMDCRLLRELKSYNAANKLLLTGTPLQNSLRELWSLLNFLLPDVFDDASAFEDWFNFSSSLGAATDDAGVAADDEHFLVSKLHAILQPFLLRRLKADVELGIPKKTELLLYAGMADAQRTLYEAALKRSLRDKLTKAADDGARSARHMKLQNLVMQLRKACNHPYLFEYPLEPDGGLLIDEQLVATSGKLQLLDRMLPRLEAGGHKILIFTQMTKTVDILQDYCWLRNYGFCRFDGTMKHEERETAVARFNSDPEKFLFLLSTRAGGLGITLNAADTVIIFDSDWNPQCDLQAQDRCHRIGQTRPVVVYRLATARTVEVQILKRANDKRKLERMVIHKRQFKGVDRTTDRLQAEELVALLAAGDAALEDQRALDDDDTIARLCDRDAVMGMPIGSAGPGYAVVDEAAAAADDFGAIAH